jgi:hypothetical protein
MHLIRDITGEFRPRLREREFLPSRASCDRLTHVPEFDFLRCGICPAEAPV